MTDIATLGIKVDAREVDRGRASLDQLSNSGDKAEQSTRKLASASEILAGALGRVTGILATIGVSRFIAESSALYQRYDQLGLILGVVGTNTGNLRSEIDKTVESVKNQGISMIESRQTVLKLMQANLDLSNATKLATLAQDAATIGNINSSQALDTLIHGVTTAQIDVLRTIGINVNFEQSYKRLADSLGVTTNQLTENQKMQARLNETLSKAPDIAGAYAASMENAGKIMKSTDRLAENLRVQLGEIFGEAALMGAVNYKNELDKLNDQVQSLSKDGSLKAWGRDIAMTLAQVADVARNATNIVGGLISTAVVNVQNILKGDFRAVFEASRQAGVNLRMQLEDSNRYQDALEKRFAVQDMLTKQVTGYNNNLRQERNNLEQNTTATEKLTKAKHELTLEMLRQQESTKFTIDLDNEVKRVTKDVMTEQEKYNAKVEELDRIKPYLTVETYNRALQKAQDELDKTRQVTQTSTDAISQLWIQAGRNIQTTLSNSIFDFFNGGLKNMLQNVKNTVLRITAEFASLKISQAIGLDKIFSPGAAVSGGAANFSLGNILSAGSNLFSSAGSGIGSLIGRGASALGFSSFGAGASGAASAGVFGAGGLNFLGGAGTAIGAGAEFGAAATMGAGLSSTLGAIAGPLAIAAAVDMGLRAIFGNKSIGGTAGKVLGYVPIVGTLINGLFGRGPLKQKETQLTGEVGAGGLLDGYLTANFKAKGGLLVGSKRDFAGVNLLTGAAETDNGKLQGVADGMVKYAMQLAQQINQSVGLVNTSLRDLSGTLGLSTKPLDDFRHQINLVSESGKALTDEQIAQEIANISDEMVKSLLPTVDQFAKSGESSIQTITRLDAEFNALVSGAQLLLGKSATDAKTLVSGSTYEGRTAFVDAAGGLDALNQQVTFFADNFLTDAQRLAPVQEQLNAGLKNLGLSTDLTRDQFRELVQSFGQVNGISEKTLQALLALAPAFVQVRDQAKSLMSEAFTGLQVRDQAKSLMSEAFTGLQSAVESERTKITRQYNSNLTDVNAHIDDITQSIGKLSNLSDALKATVSDIFPVTRDAAKRQIQDAIASARSGGMLPDADSLRGALGVLGKIDPGSYGSALDYAREQARTANLVADLGKLTDGQLTVEQRSLSALIDQRTALTTGFEQETARLDGLLTQGQAQIDALNGIKTNIVPLSDALAKFNSAIVSAGGVAGSGSAMAGTESAYNPNITPQQIRDFVATPGITEMDIYNKARDSGVGFGQYAAATGSNIVDLYAWADAHGLPRFASGGFHRGGLRIVGENGPELEYTPPSRIFNNADARSIINPQQNKDLIDAIKELKDQLIRVEANTRAGAVHGSTTAGILKRVTPDGDKIATGTA